MKALDISQNGKYIFTGSDIKLKVWELDREGKEQKYIGHSSMIELVKFAFDYRYLYSVTQGYDGIFVWEFFGDSNIKQTKKQSPKKVEFS